jgi:hypothetical protein
LRVAWNKGRGAVAEARQCMKKEPAQFGRPVTKGETGHARGLCYGNDVVLVEEQGGRRPAVEAC